MHQQIANYRMPDHDALQPGEHGWVAVSRYRLPAGFALAFRTGRHDARLETVATLESPVDVGETWQELLASAPIARVTKERVAKDHRRVMAQHFDRILATVVERYQFHRGAHPVVTAAMQLLAPSGSAAGGVPASTLRDAVTAGFAVTADAQSGAVRLVTVLDGQCATLDAVRARRHAWAGALHTLAKAHDTYGSYNQQERKDVRRMVELGHPCSQDYMRLRRYFDRLLFACNSEARRVTWIDEDERADYWAPRLGVSWAPTGLPGYWQVDPAHPDWNAYLADAARAGWPPGVAPSLDTGSWHIVTQHAALKAALLALDGATTSASTREGRPGRCLKVRVHPGPNALATHAQVLRLLRKYQGTGLLPCRRPADDAADRAPLPLHEKDCMLAAAEQVTVGDRKILIPLVPLGEQGRETVRRTVDQLLALVDQGLPLACVAWWLKDWLTPESMAQLAGARQHAPVHPE